MKRQIYPKTYGFPIQYYANEFVQKDFIDSFFYYCILIWIFITYFLLNNNVINPDNNISNISLHLQTNQSVEKIIQNTNLNRSIYEVRGGILYEVMLLSIIIFLWEIQLAEEFLPTTSDTAIIS